MPNIEQPQDYPVIEFRRYTIKQGEREHFISYFETYFPEAFQQLGALAIGEFRERDNPVGFTWIRGFHSMDDRAKINATFYYGPVWKEHKAAVNQLITDSDNVLLLRPINSSKGLPIFPAVDPVSEAEGAKGVIVAQIFAVKPDSVDAFVEKSEQLFANYRGAGMREAGVLRTLDAANNFPQLPVRNDGPYVVWLGIAPGSATSGDSSLSRMMMEKAQPLIDTGLLRGVPEVVVLDPARRSRLRWLDSK